MAAVALVLASAPLTAGEAAGGPVVEVDAEAGHAVATLSVPPIPTPTVPPTPTPNLPSIPIPVPTPTLPPIPKPTLPPTLAPTPVPTRAASPPPATRAPRPSAARTPVPSAAPTRAPAPARTAAAPLNPTSTPTVAAPDPAPGRTSEPTTVPGVRPPGPAPPGAPPEARNPLGAAVSGVVDQLATVVKPEAAGAVATTFAFPLILMVAVVIFLILQGRLDEDDPKLRLAPQTGAETIVAFGEEERP